MMYHDLLILCIFYFVPLLKVPEERALKLSFTCRIALSSNTNKDLMVIVIV